MAVLIWRLPPRSRRWRLVLPRADRDRRDAAGAGELGVGGEALGAGDLADQLARGQRAKSGLGEQLWGHLAHELADLVEFGGRVVRQMAEDAVQTPAVVQAGVGPELGL